MYIYVLAHTCVSQNAYRSLHPPFKKKKKNSMMSLLEM